MKTIQNKKHQIEMKPETGIPIPEKYNHSGFSGAVRRMKTGESIFVAGENTSRVGGRVGYIRVQTGFKFTCRTVTENGIQGCRIWRTE